MAMKIKTTQKCIKIAMTTVGHHTGVQISRDICCRFGRYLYSTKCSWIITLLISVADASFLKNMQDAYYFEYFFFRDSSNSSGRTLTNSILGYSIFYSSYRILLETMTGILQ